MKVEWAKYIIDVRLGFQKSGEWKFGTLQLWNPVTQNFWNGIFTLNVYVVKTTLFRFFSLLVPRINLVCRFAHDHWFEAGIGYLFDRGEFGVKCVIQNWQNEEKFNPGVNAKGWEEGPV
ncbi:MAG: hypothetical protein O8C67_06105 [Candidatus Methanoperedens sp.]|nr:hypothetical protein [Candidatus Methanoperedens sp.]